MEAYIQPELTQELREAIDLFIMGKDKDGKEIESLAHGQIAFAYIDGKLSRLDGDFRMKVLTSEVYPAARDITKKFKNATIES